MWSWRTRVDEIFLVGKKLNNFKWIFIKVFMARSTIKHPLSVLQVCSRCVPAAAWHHVSNNCVQSGQLGCPRKGYVRQPGDTSKNPEYRESSRSYARRTHGHITQLHEQNCIFSNTIFCLPLLVFGLSAFFALRTWRTTTNSVNVFNMVDKQHFSKNQWRQRLGFLIGVQRLWTLYL